MSETAVQSSLYEELTNLADTVDDLLFHLRTGHTEHDDPARRRLADFLARASGNKVAEDLVALRLLTLLGCTTPKDKNALARLGETLRRHDPLSEATIQRLETLARELEARRTETVTKMRGNVR
jgi:hypothetical protein